MENQKLWTPPAENFAHSHMARFIRYVEDQYRIKIADYFALHDWSIRNSAEFWEAVWKFCDLQLSQDPEKIKVAGKRMQETRWFAGARLNFAQNLLKRRDDHPALIFACENGKRSQLTFNELYQKVAAVAAFLKKIGIQTGDRVAGFLPNCPETVIAMLATTSIGAVWTACSSDFGVNALLDRFEQVQPKVLFAADAHVYSGKTFPHMQAIEQLQQRLPSLIQTIIVPFIQDQSEIISLNRSILLTEVIEQNRSNNEIEFVQTTFDHPVYILYSSGTTGKPKCMVHSAGGTLIQHLKELMLHTNLHRDEKICFYTTCGWMMWNWLISSLAVGACVVLYEGNPFHPKADTLFDLIDELNINVLGVGAKLIEIAESRDLTPMNTHSFANLRTLLTTASPLLPESFDYIYRSIKKELQVSSISGGSDIISCFALGNPLLPIYRGEIQCIGLGMDVKIFNDHGQTVTQQKGELVCASPFPSMPVYFWNDPEGEKYQRAYFERYPGVWAHGDYAMITQHHGMIIFGRSDATLNPGGVRIGTAEIYDQVQKFAEVIDCLSVGQLWKGSERVILFVVLQQNHKLTEELAKKIKQSIRANTSPHHVPAKIIAVPDLPRTISGKIMELTIKKIIHNEPVQNIETLANPNCLEYFKNIHELHED